MKKRKYIFKEVVTLLIIALLSFSSTVVIANTTNEKKECQFGITSFDNSEINEKISNGTAVVITAEEMVKIVEEKGTSVAAEEIDFVIENSRGP